MKAPIVQLNDNFSVSGELNNEILAQLIDRGLTMLINVRPDNETANQKNSHEWQQCCESLKISYHHIPVQSGKYSKHDIALFKQLLQHPKGLIHCFCRSGTRAAHLWAISQQDTYSFQQLQQTCSSKGYDLTTINNYFS